MDRVRATTPKGRAYQYLPMRTRSGSSSLHGAETPTELARAEDAPYTDGSAAIDPWGAAANRPVIDDIGKPALREEQILAPIPIQPVQDRLVEKLVHLVRKY